MVAPRPARRRSGLVQERSRRTRQRLVRAALQLWTERGFEHGVEDTTVEEIVRLAGVTKGTFYFHFVRKEEILLEMGWESAAVLNEEARRCVATGRTTDDAIGRMMRVLARHIGAAPPAAVARAVSEFRHLPAAGARAGGRKGFVHAFEHVFVRAEEEGELPAGIDAVEAAQMLQALVMDSILSWAASGKDLEVLLQHRSALLLGGLRALVP